MTDIENKIKAAEEIKSQLLAEQKKLSEEVKKNADQVEVKLDDMVNSVKSVADSMVATANAMQEAIKLEAEAKKNKIETENKNDKLFVGGNSDIISEIKYELEEVSNKLLRDNSEVENYNFCEHKHFDEFLDKIVSLDHYGTKEERNATVANIKQDFLKMSKQFGSDTKRIPLFNFETKTSTAYRESVGRDGGFVMRPATVRQEITALYDAAQPSMRDVCRIIKTYNKEYETLCKLEGLPAEWAGEESPKAGPAGQNFAKLSIKNSELTKASFITRQGLEDSSINLYNVVADDFMTQFSKAESLAFWKGNGLNDKPMGLFNPTIYGEIGVEDKYELNKFRTDEYSISTGALGLIDAASRAKDKLQGNGVNRIVFVMHPYTYSALNTAKDATSNYILDKGMPRYQSSIRQLMGVPVITDINIPPMFDYSGTPLEDVKGIFVGNLFETYTIVDRLQPIIWLDAATDQTYVKYFGRKRVGGGAEQFNLGMFIKSKA